MQRLQDAIGEILTRPADDARRARGGPRGPPRRPVVRGAGHQQLGHVPQAGRRPRPAVLRARRRPQRDLRPPRRVAGPPDARSRTRTPWPRSWSATSPRFPGSSKGELARWWGVGTGELRAPLAALGDRVTPIARRGHEGLREDPGPRRSWPRPSPTTPSGCSAASTRTRSQPPEGGRAAAAARTPRRSSPARPAGSAPSLLAGGRVVGHVDAPGDAANGDDRPRAVAAPHEGGAGHARPEAADGIAAFLVPGAEAHMRVADPA